MKQWAQPLAVESLPRSREYERKPYPILFPLSRGSLLISACWTDLGCDSLQMLPCFYFIGKINPEAEEVTHFCVRLSSHREVTKGSAKTRHCLGSVVPILLSLPCGMPCTAPGINPQLDLAHPGAQKGRFKEELQQMYQQGSRESCVPWLFPSSCCLESLFTHVFYTDSNRSGGISWTQRGV